MRWRRSQASLPFALLREDDSYSLMPRDPKSVPAKVATTREAAMLRAMYERLTEAYGPQQRLRPAGVDNLLVPDHWPVSLSLR